MDEQSGLASMEQGARAAKDVGAGDRRRWPGAGGDGRCVSRSLRDALRVNWNGLDLAAARTVLEALQALDRGEATADQQRVALAALRDMFCRAPLLSFSTEPLLMAALEGRRLGLDRV